jgi:hypothetical protein
MRIGSNDSGLKARHIPAQWQRLGFGRAHHARRPVRAIDSFLQPRFMQPDGDGRYVALSGRRTGCASFHTRGVATGLGYAGLSALASPMSLRRRCRDAMRRVSAVHTVPRRRQASNLDNPVQAAGAARGGYGSPDARTAKQFNCFAVVDEGCAPFPELPPSLRSGLHGVIHVRRHTASGVARQGIHINRKHQ